MENSVNKETTKKPIGIICALEVEMKDLLAELQNREDETFHGYDFHSGRIGELPVVLIQCGVGKVNAARGTQMLIDRFDPCCIVNSGIAGGTKKGLSIGDIVVGTDLVQHDFDVTSFGYAKGYMCTGEDSTKPTVFTAEPTLVNALVEAAHRTAPERGVHPGRIVSGDQFISGAEKKTELREVFDATCAEMESAAIAQTCQYSDVPFGILRVISDLADGTAPDSYDQFEEASANLSAAVILAFLGSRK
ncbi:MAG: 5'-methylthioadenosine/adenosylhomocysteine nucleosidase [Eubacteriales bacterium]|nr:5'-methylthioadenosine/adenosylhomocysteine nucleosidase [Eubacteriales bacterium]